MIAPRFLPGLVAAGGVLVAAWMAAGRVLFGISGSLVLWLTPTVGLAAALIAIFTGVAIARTRRAGFRTRGTVVTFVVLSWLLGIGFGLTVAEHTDSGARSVLGLFGSEVAVEIGIGLCNPMVSVSLTLAVAALWIALVDARGPRAPRTAEEETPTGMYAPDGTFHPFETAIPAQPTTAAVADTTNTDTTSTGPTPSA